MPEEKDAPEPAAWEGESEVRESVRIHALIASIGSKMGMKAWVPRGDRGCVVEALDGDDVPLLDGLPLDYDETTIRTIEQIDVLWLREPRPQNSAAEVDPVAGGVMFTVQIGQEIRTLADLSESWVNQQINRRRTDGLPVCVMVTIKDGDVDVVLPTPGCGPRGPGGREANPKERRVIDLWKKLHLDSDDFTGGNLNAFLKQVQRI